MGQMLDGAIHLDGGRDRPHDVHGTIPWAFAPGRLPANELKSNPPAAPCISAALLVDRYARTPQRCDVAFFA